MHRSVFESGAMFDPPDWVDHPMRLDPETGQVFRYDPEWRAYIGVYFVSGDGSESRRTPISMAMLRRSLRHSPAAGNCQTTQGSAQNGC